LKRQLFLLFGVFVAVLAAGWLLIPFDAPRISQANCDKIQEGWSEKQVEDLVGSYTLCIGEGGGMIGSVVQRSSDSKMWRDGDGNSIHVSFNNERVTDKSFAASELSFSEQMKARIQRRLKAVWP
jgi:hypothetical protein